MKLSLKSCGAPFVLALSCGSFAQSYHAVVIPTSYTWALGGSNGIAVGSKSLSPSSFSGHAVTWDLSGAMTDIHPSFLDSATTAGVSQAMSSENDIIVGAGRGSVTNNRLAAIIWLAGSASLLPMPNGGDNYGSQAESTDGLQVVGTFTPWGSIRDHVAPGDQHAFVYDINSGSLVDLYNGNPCVGLDCKLGRQVGYEIRGQAEARLWSGRARNFINLHPNGFDSSMAISLDDGIQVGSVARIVNKLGEAKRGIKIRYDQACTWAGSASSMSLLFSQYANSFSNDVTGQTICGNGIVTGFNGLRGPYHALVWATPSSAATELHNVLPFGYSQSFANRVDSSGNVFGSAIDAAGISHAVIWIRD